MKIIKVESGCGNCPYGPDQMGICKEKTVYNEIPSWCPLEDAPEPCSCPTAKSPGIIICGTCGGEVV